MTAIRGYLGAGVVAISLLFLLGCATTGEMTQLENNIGELQADMAKTQSTLTALQTTLTGLDNRLQTIEEQATKQAMLSQEMEAIIEQFRVQLAKQEEVLANLRQEFTATLLHQQSTPTETPLSPQEPLTTRSAPPITAPASPPTAPTSSTTVSTPPLSSDELYRQAYEAFTAKEYEKAVDLFSTYVQNYPENDLADNSQYWIGESYYFLQNYQQALEAFQEVIAKYPLGNKVADALLKRGLTFVTLQEYEAALREFQKVIDRYPTSSVAQIARENITEIQKIR